MFGFTRRKEQKAEIRAEKRIMQLLMDRMPRWTNWTTEAAVNEGFKASVWVFAAINKKAKAAASVPWYVYRKNTAGEFERLPTHPLQTLIDKPNPFTSRNNMIERLIMQLDLAGNSLFHMVKVGNTPVELWSIGPDGLRPVPDERDFIKNYEFKMAKNGRKVSIPTDEVLHVMYVDPSNPYWGIAPLMVAAKTVDTDIEAVSWNKVALQNRAVTDGAFVTDQPLTDTQYNSLRSQVREQHQGAANARAPWVLGGGARWQQMSLSPADMDFIEGRKMTREEIAAVFQVPPPLLGILDKANYSNMQEARRVFWLDTVIPLLDDLKEAFNRALTPYFGEDIELDYDISGVEALQENVSEKIKSAKELWSMGVPFNQINQRLDLGIDEIEGGDTGYLPLNLVPANLANVVRDGRGGVIDLNTGGQTEEKSIKKKRGRRFKGFQIETDEEKAAYYKAIETERAPWDETMKRAALERLEADRKAIISAWKQSEGDLETTLQAIDSDAWEAFYTRFYQSIIREFAKETYSGIKYYFPSENKEGESIGWDPITGAILDYIFDASAQKVTYVTDYTKELTKGIIYTGRDNGDTLDMIARDLSLSLEEYNLQRAYTIAITEVGAASSYGSYIGAQSASEEVGPLTKEWVSSGDERVRESHQYLNGQIVPLSKLFSNGLEYPGDMLRGKAEEVIRCRCVLAYNAIT